MSWSRSVSCLLSAAVLLAGCKTAPSLQVVGDSTRLEQAQPSPTESALFDGTTLKLRAARGETLGFSVRTSDALEHETRLELPVEVATVSPYSVRSLDVQQPSTELYGPSSGAGRYPDVLRPMPQPVKGQGLAYFDVAVPQQARPGRYGGSLRIDARVIPVELRISSASLDLEPRPLVWVFYLPREIARVHGLADDDSPRLLEEETKYYELFRAHGALLAADLPPARFEPRRAFMRDVAFWPVAIDTSSEAAIARDVQRWLELFRDSKVTPFAIPVDEPHTAEDQQKVRRICEAVARAGGGRPRLLCGVTDAKRAVYGSSVDLYISPENFPTAAGAAHGSGERFWTYNGRPPAAGSMILDTDGAALRTWGWIAERYGIELWYAWEGLYFSDRYNRGGPTDVLRDPITFDERSRGGTDFGNGDGLLAYPGPLPSLRLKALRRGLQDRLLLEQLATCAGRARAERIVRRVVPRALGAGRGKASWAIEEPAWEQARQEVLDGIEQECHGRQAMAQ